MIKVSNSYLLKVLTKLLILLVVAKALSLALLWYLPSDGVGLAQKENYQPKYQRVDFKNMLQTLKGAKIVEQSTKTTSSVSITNMTLKALYGKEAKGFVIVALKSSPKKTEIIGIGEVYSGFTLKLIKPRSAIFSKGGKDYVLNLEELKNQKSFITKVVKQGNSGEPKVVTRRDINKYKNNPSALWKDIAIRPLSPGKGYKVTRITKGSKIAELGLQKGDIIIKANNVELKTLKNVTDMYMDIDTIDTMQIVVLRNNQEKELVYEIN